MKQQLLLLDDVDGLGRSGDIVSARPGFVRNFLLPQKKAVILDKKTMGMRARLQKEREERAQKDRVLSEDLAAKLQGVSVSIEVKVDHEGHMYGSVTALDIARLLQKEGYDVDRKMVFLPQPIKKLGKYEIQLRLKEEVPALVMLEVLSEDAGKAS